jgi:hypothetical protein
MSRGKTALIVGPWPAGMNTRDDPSELLETELADVVNLDIESTGALIPRRGWQEVAVSAPSKKIVPLLIYYNYQNVSRALFARVINDGAGTEQTSFFNITNTAYADQKNVAGANIVRTGLFSTAFTYATPGAGGGSIYFVPDHRSQASPVGFRLDSLANQDPVNVAAIPKGQFSFILNDRAFVFNPYFGRLYWSKAADPTVWAAPDGGWVDIDPSDEPFTDCVLVRTTVYLIRGNAIYSFNFTSDPGIDGNVSKLANSEGAIMGTAYQNELYLVTPRGLFKFLNGYMTLVSDKVVLGVITGVPSYSDLNGMTVIEHTLWIRSWDGTTLKHVAFNLRTGACSRYNHANLTDIVGKSISDTQYTYLSSSDYSKVCVVTNQRSNTKVTAGGKDMGYGFTTKRISMGSRLIWKRLISWLVDYNTRPQFHDNNTTKFFAKAGASTSFDTQVTYTGQAAVSSASSDGRIDTKSLRFKDLQLGMQTNQQGSANPAGVNADAGITVRQIMLFYSASREMSNLQT